MWRWAIRLLAIAWYACLVFAGGWSYEMAFSSWHEGDTDQIMGVVGFVLVIVLALVPIAIFIARRAGREYRSVKHAATNSKSEG
jgi:ABC-type Fe3+ transport system permease subunit